MLEANLQSKFINLVKKHKLGIAVKVDSSSRRGWPDVTYVDWKGDITLIEFKKQGGKLSPHQQALHDELIELGAEVITINGEGRLNHFINQLLDEFSTFRIPA